MILEENDLVFPLKYHENEHFLKQLFTNEPPLIGTLILGLLSGVEGRII